MIRKSFVLYSPVTILTITWIVVFSLYLYNPFNLEPIRGFTWFVLGTGLLLIYLGFFTAKLLGYGFQVFTTFDQRNDFPFNIDKIRKVVLVLSIVSFSGVLATMFLFFQLLPSFEIYLLDPGMVRKLLIEASMGEKGINVPLFKIANHMASLNSMAIIMAGAISSIKRCRFISILPLFVSAVYSLMTLQRVYFIKHYMLWIICSFIFIYFFPAGMQKAAIKRFLKKILLFILIAGSFILFVIVLRTLFDLGVTTDRVINSFYFYSAGNIFLLDKYFISDPSFYDGASLFRSFVNWFVGFGLMEKSAVIYPHYEFHKIYNTIGNTFTYIRMTYEDFGVLGVIVISYIWGWLGFVAINSYLKSFSFAKMGIAAMFIFSFFWSFYGFAWSHLTAILLMFFQLYLVDVLFLRKRKIYSE